MPMDITKSSLENCCVTRKKKMGMYQDISVFFSAREFRKTDCVNGEWKRTCPLFSVIAQRR